MATGDYNSEKYFFEYPEPEEVISLMKKSAVKRSVRDIALLINYIQRANLMIFQTEAGSNSNVRDLIAKSLSFIQIVKKEAGTVLFHLDQYLDNLYLLVKGTAKGFQAGAVDVMQPENKNPQPQMELSSPVLFKAPRKALKLQLESCDKEPFSPRASDKSKNIDTWRSSSEIGQANMPKDTADLASLFVRDSVFSSNIPSTPKNNYLESFEEKVFSSFPERKHQYFSGTSLKVEAVDNYKDGAIIGEQSFLSEKGIASTAVITYQDCYLLALSRKDYDLLFAGEIMRMKEKINFLETVFPQVSRSQLAVVSYFFEKILCRTEKMIYKQDQEATAVYLVQKGEVQLSRSIKLEGEVKIDKALIQGNKTIYKAAALNDGELFGEDLISNKKTYLYSAKVTKLGTMVYRVDEQSVKKMETLFKDFYECFRSTLETKAVARENGFKDYCADHSLYEDYSAFFMASREEQNAAQGIPITINSHSAASKNNEYFQGYIKIPKRNYIPKLSLATFAKENVVSFSDYVKADKEFIAKLRDLTKGHKKSLTKVSNLHSPKHSQNEIGSEFEEFTRIKSTRPKTKSKNLSNDMRKGMKSFDLTKQSEYKTSPTIKSASKMSLNLKSFDGYRTPSGLTIEKPQHKDLSEVKSQASLKTLRTPNKTSKRIDLKNAKPAEIKYFPAFISPRFIPHTKLNPNLVNQKAAFPSARSLSNPNVLVSFSNRY